MFDFKKGKASDKVLSEQEIQQKLYGRFLTNKNIPAGASETYSRPVPKSSSSSSAVLFPEETIQDPAESRSSELLSESRASEKKVERKDPPAPAAAVSKDNFREKFQAAENDLLKNVRNKPLAPKVSFQKALPKFQLPKIPLPQIMGAVSSAVSAFLNMIFSFLFAIGRVVDFRKEGVRTGLAWGSGVVMLVLLLAAIQGLNSKREIAMKTSVPKAPKKISAKASAKKETVPAVILTEGQEQLSSVADRNATALTPVQEETKTDDKTPAAADISNGRFVIQVATYVIRDDANRLLQDLQKIEKRSFVKGLSRASGKTYYSVFLGRFESFQTGQQALAKFKKSDLSRSFKDAFIRTLDA